VGATPAKVSISAGASWKTSSGIGFSLTPQASCSVAVAATSAPFAVAQSIDSSAMRNVVSGPIDGAVYVNIELDFSITGAVSGSGTVSGIGISGRASGSGAASFCYCHRADAGTTLGEALEEAFASIVFPFEPNAALRMPPSDIARVNFDANLNFGLNVSYGLGSFQFSAPGVDSVQKSLSKGLENFKLPRVDLEAGAKASISYTHSDHFGYIVQKMDDRTAMLYVVRSGLDEFDASAGVSVGVSATKLGVTVDQTKLAGTISDVTGAGASIASQVAGVVDSVQSALVSKANAWITAEKGDAGLLVQLSRQNRRALLYEFQADLANPALAEQTWGQLAQGDVEKALSIGGLTLLPGSGVCAEMKRSVSIGLHFFNLFSVTEITTYFQKSRTEVGPDGSIRFLFDVGQESDVKTKNALTTSRIYFTARADGDGRGSVSNAVVNLVIELSETNKPKDGAHLISILDGAAADAQDALRQFLAANPTATLSLALTFAPSAYQRLAETAARLNWNAFHDAAQKLFALEYLSRLAYPDWQSFNQIADGNPAAVTPSFYATRGILVPQLASYFLVRSGRFLQLCTYLHTLAQAQATVDSLKTWNSLLAGLTRLVKDDTSADWSRPAAAALLQLCSSGTPVTAEVIRGTCTVALR